MKCPYCNNPITKVIDKRELNNLENTRRRRECLKCEKRFTTYEYVGTLDLVVIKKDKTKEPFNIEKVKAGLVRSLEKRPITQSKIDEIAEKIETKIRQRKGKEIPSQEIGKEVMKVLKKLDKVAYIRFASVYNEFENIQDFKKQIKEVAK